MYTLHKQYKNMKVLKSLFMGDYFPNRLLKCLKNIVIYARR